MLKLYEDIQVHDNLNPKIWDSNSHMMLPDVREKLIEIVSSFEQYIDVPIQIVDAQVCGSNASYNYTDKSDLDLHVIANFDIIDAPDEILQQLYNAKKASFNKDMDIKIHGIEIELYIQDIRSTTVSNGIYSICDNVWIKEPKPIKSYTKHNTEKELGQWKEHISNVISSSDYDEIVNTINNLYLMRTNSIAVDGEYGKGNQLFKDIRNLGLLQSLKDAMNSALSNKLSLECLSRGQLIQRLEESYEITFKDRCK